MSNKLKHENMIGKTMKSFSFMKVLGEGAWAYVYEAFDSNRNMTVAIKVIPKIMMKETPKLQELVQTEIRVLKECKNQNVIRYVDAFSSEKSQCIAMEYCNGGDLEQYLKKKKRLTEDQATNFVKQILNGFRGLHEVNAMHRDFKVANVLLHEGICKIADLGFAKQLKTKSMATTILGTSLTMAPELLRQQKYGYEADIWSVGVVYYQLLYGKYPYNGNSDFEILKKIETMKPDYKGINLSANARNFIERCLTDNPVNRISWRQIYNHPLIKEEEKMIYGLKSKIDFKQNEEFYKNDIKINDDYIYAEKKDPGIKHKTSMDEIVQADNNKVDMEKMIKEAQIKKEISRKVQEYEKKYLNYRNNIMFIFKFVTPHIYNLFNIHANHGITLFILSKKAYHQMKQLTYHVKGKINFLKLAPYFNQFVNSPKYHGLISTTQSDLDLIYSQIQFYKEDIEYCSPQIKKQYDVDVIHCKNWEGLVHQTINSYEFQLAEGLEKVNGAKKQDLIKVIEALTYYKDNKQNADIQSFDRQVQSMNFELQEVKIRSRIDSILA